MARKEIMSLRLLNLQEWNVGGLVLDGEKPTMEVSFTMLVIKAIILGVGQEDACKALFPSPQLQCSLHMYTFGRHEFVSYLLNQPSRIYG